MTQAGEITHVIPRDKLPSGWSVATIEELVGREGVFVDGDWVESKDQDPDGNVRLIQLADIGDGQFRNKSERFLTRAKAAELGCTFLEKGDVLIARMPDPLGRACIFPGDPKAAVTAVDVAIVRSSNSNFNHRWLMYFINAPKFRTAVASLQSGTTRKRISRSNLARIALPVPVRKQQDDIVAEIEKQFSRLDEACTNLQRVKANLKRYKAAVLKAAVEGKLTEEWRKQHPDVEPANKLLERILAERRVKWDRKGKYKEPMVPDINNVPRLPENWTWVSVDQVAEVFLGKMLDKNKHRTGRQLPYLRNINVRWGRVETDDLLEMFFENDELDRYGLQLGDVLVCEGGEPGRAAVWDGRIPELKYQKALHRVRFYGSTEAHYLVFLLEFLANTGRLERWFTGSTIKHFTRESFISLPLPLPPLAEQQHVAAEVERRLSVIEELEAAVEANLKRAERLRQAILTRAFAGKLVNPELKKASASSHEFPVSAESRSTYRAARRERRSL